MQKRVVITGIGGICGLGTDAAAIWGAMRAGRSAIGPIENVELHELKVRIGSQVKALPEHGIDRKQIATMDRFSLLAVIAPNLPCKPNTVMFNKGTIKGAKQAVQMFGPAQFAVAKAVQDSVADGTIPAAEADDVFICVGVFIHWEAADDAKIQDYNYRATKEAIARAVAGTPTAAEATKQRDSVKHPFGAS